MKNRSYLPGRQWIPVVLWIGVIALESTPTFSSDHTRHALYMLLAALVPGSMLAHVGGSLVSHVNLALRTAGHVVGYGILSWLSFRAWRATLETSRFGGRLLRCAVLAVLVTAAVAALDEWHQSFIPSRAGKFTDVMLDMAAGMAAQVLIFGESKLRISSTSTTSPIPMS